MACLIAHWLSTGSVPGNAQSTTFACAFGPAPYSVLDVENSFDFVVSCAWTSRPITTCHWVDMSAPEVTQGDVGEGSFVGFDFAIKEGS